MSGRHPFQELSRELAAERSQRIDAIKRELLAEMPLHELRLIVHAMPQGPEAAPTIPSPQRQRLQGRGCRRPHGHRP